MLLSLGLVVALNYCSLVAHISTHAEQEPLTPNVMKKILVTPTSLLLLIITSLLKITNDIFTNETELIMADMPCLLLWITVLSDYTRTWTVYSCKIAQKKTLRVIMIQTISFIIQNWYFAQRKVWRLWVLNGVQGVLFLFVAFGLLLQRRALFEWDDADIEDRYKPPRKLSEFVRHFFKLIPFIWPKSSNLGTKLKLYLITCFLIMALGRLVNLLVPIMYKNVVDSLGGLNTLDLPQNIPLKELGMFVGIRFLAGSSGALQSIQSYLWVPVGQYTTRQVSVQMLNHLLKYDYYRLMLVCLLNSSRKTGEILRVQDRGVASIVSLLSVIVFNIIPTLGGNDDLVNTLDIAIACFYFTAHFDMLFGGLVFFTMFFYLGATIILTEWRIKYRKKANELDNDMEAKAVDSLLNFETVKYYCAEEFEVCRYEDAVKRYHSADLFSSITQWALDVIQNIIIQLSLFLGCLLCAKRIIIDKTMTVGDFVLYLTYLVQLYGPLNWFGNYYRVIQKNFVDMEKMLDLFKEPLEIEDMTDAQPIKVTEGLIEFDSVGFQYDKRRETVSKISFKIKPGTTTAFVGASGGGKTTIGRLLFRFYDPNEGSISIDGINIRSVPLKSLREAIGVVPQDTILFNDSIRYNILYAKPTATETELIAATKAAQIHDRILSFPDGYDTQVGERGLRLSGGEKQRVAIARTLLKDPKILILDEATSALDNNSEASLQKALSHKPRTTIIIAHRLSTIVSAEQIIVLVSGRIVESGKHQELLDAKGEYYSLWMKQLSD